MSTKRQKWKAIRRAKRDVNETPMNWGRNQNQSHVHFGKSRSSGESGPQKRWEGSIKEILDSLANTIPTISKKDDRKSLAEAAELLKRNRNNIAKLFDEMSKFIAENSNEVIKNLIWQNSQILNQKNIRLDEIKDTQLTQLDMHQPKQDWV